MLHVKRLETGRDLGDFFLETKICIYILHRLRNGREKKAFWLTFYYKQKHVIKLLKMGLIKLS